VSGIELIFEERYRHEELGYTPDDDLEHVNSELLAAAICYAVDCDPLNLDPTTDQTLARYMWPWAKESWKPSRDAIRNLAKAGALIAAEIDRLQAHALSAFDQEDAE
jgi:hypothetical protein